MEIYNNESTKAHKEFEQLLNNHSSKSKVEEGKVVEGKISKITEGETWCKIYSKGQDKWGQK